MAELFITLTILLIYQVTVRKPIPYYPNTVWVDLNPIEHGHHSTPSYLSGYLCSQDVLFRFHGDARGGGCQALTLVICGGAGHSRLDGTGFQVSPIPKSQDGVFCSGWYNMGLTEKRSLAQGICVTVYCSIVILYTHHNVNFLYWLCVGISRSFILWLSLYWRCHLMGIYLVYCICCATLISYLHTGLCMHR